MSLPTDLWYNLEKCQLLKVSNIVRSDELSLSVQDGKFSLWNFSDVLKRLLVIVSQPIHEALSTANLAETFSPPVRPPHHRLCCEASVCPPDEGQRDFWWTSSGSSQFGLRDHQSVTSHHGLFGLHGLHWSCGCCQGKYYLYVVKLPALSNLGPMDKF